MIFFAFWSSLVFSGFSGLGVLSAPDLFVLEVSAVEVVLIKPNFLASAGVTTAVIPPAFSLNLNA